MRSASRRFYPCRRHRQSRWRFGHLRSTLALLGIIASAQPVAAQGQTPGSASGANGTLQTVVVTGTGPTTQTTAIEDQRLAPNIENVQSAEQIARFPDVNAGDALRRLPGIGVQNDTGESRYVTIRGLDSNLSDITFNHVRIPSTDPNGRHVGLDQIPADLVSRIVLTKTNLPEQDAEALGGTVDLVPRSAFDLEKPFLSGSIGSGYEPLRPRYPIINGSIVGGLTFGVGPDGNPFGARSPRSEDKRAESLSKEGKGGVATEAADDIWNARPFGILGQFSYYEDHRGIDDFEPAYADAAVPIGSDKLLNQVDFRRYTYNRRLHGYGTNVEFRPNVNHSYYVSFVGAGYVEKVVRQRFDILGLDGSNNPDTPVAPVLGAVIPGGYFVPNAAIQAALRNNEERFDNVIVQGGGHDVLGPVILDYQGSFAQAYDRNPRDFNLSFQTPNDQQVGYNNSGLSNQPAFYLGGPNPYDPRRYTFSGLRIDSNQTLDTEIAGRADLTIPFEVWGNQSNFKLGTNLRFRTKSHYDNPRTYTGYADPAVGGANDFTLADVLGNNFNSIYGGYYRLGRAPDEARSDRFYYRNRGNFTRDTVGDAVTSLQNFFDDSENVFAGYFQYDLTWGRLNLLAGLRIEATDAVYGAYENVGGSDPNDPASYRFVDRYTSYVNYFPTFQATYRFTDTLQARFVYSTAIGRPAFNQVTASTITDVGNQTITTGNPNLKPTTSDSFDLIFEWYPNKGSVLSFGLFDKEFTDYVFQRSVRVPLGGTIFTESTFLNSANARARGIEFNCQQQFSFLPGPLGGFGIALNYTYVDSEGEARPGEQTKLPFTSPNLFNAALFYEKYGVGLSLSAHFTDRNLSSVGGTAGTDQYFDKRFTLDLGASYRLTQNFTVYFNVKNLTNAPWRIYEGRADRPIQREFYDYTYEAGLKFTF